MEDIICPYPWDCGKTIEAKKLSKHDYDFLYNASEKKMTFMIIHCPECSREFKFNTVQWKSDKFGYSDPNITIETKKKTIKQLTTILDRAKVEIPLAYFDYLISRKFDPQISIFSNEENFNLYDLNQLCEKINVDGTSYLTISQLKGFANSLIEVTGGISSKGQDLNYKDISNCLTIGSEGTKLLCIDYRDGNSLWVFHPDGGDIESLSVTLENIIERQNLYK
ncbi:hypothetical protein C1637_22570 [Chryseobacterium lactis]|uniref:SMI1/KNR4 family protein n=1 Tax=Chryseobacterium lactis TaxID=1241981 RepID=A0A3G6RQM9_CHRLC|nr:hypothetical protein [Chryseobacterium lactis]AZA80537.1 hypothetical protein EG342_00765 [Chryseobacterium lactis]AZB05539.1 hypothetical protein EG341_16890 [Chryseobacterium lactis]PNW11327.1 hypothetical protein C1637_22570 [Chryseobacterium lactis]